MTGFGYTDIIEATQDVEGLIYRLHTIEMREVYELILSSIHTALGDKAQDIVQSAADTVLEMLKNENLKDFDKGDRGGCWPAFQRKFLPARHTVEDHRLWR